MSRAISRGVNQGNAYLRYAIRSFESGLCFVETCFTHRDFRSRFLLTWSGYHLAKQRLSTPNGACDINDRDREWTLYISQSPVFLDVSKV